MAKMNMLMREKKRLKIAKKYATRRAERRRARVAARVQQFWSVEAVPAVR